VNPYSHRTGIIERRSCDSDPFSFRFADDPGIAHEMHATALPGGVERLDDGGLEALMGIRDDEFDAPRGNITVSPP
jgi:hypothetical protein